MLSYRVFEKFARMLLEGYAEEWGATDMALPVLFARVRGLAFHVDAENPLRTEMAGLSMRMFRIWRTRLRVIDGGAEPTEDDLRRITYSEWADAMHTIYWRIPHIDHLHLECVAVTMAYCNMRLGSRVILHVQEKLGTKELTSRIDRATVYAIARAAKTRELGRAFCGELLEWGGIDSERINAYLLRLDLAEDEVE